MTKGLFSFSLNAVLTRRKGKNNKFCIVLYRICVNIVRKIYLSEEYELV